jgi:hypothetical protein
MKRFDLVRHVDVSGVSGTGIVATGIRFRRGLTIIKWHGDRPSLVFWRKFSDAESVHGHGGATKFVYR